MLFKERNPCLHRESYETHKQKNAELPAVKVAST
jgi:hypothetical protein